MDKLCVMDFKEYTTSFFCAQYIVHPMRGFICFSWDKIYRVKLFPSTWFKILLCPFHCKRLMEHFRKPKIILKRTQIDKQFHSWINSALPDILRPRNWANRSVREIRDFNQRRKWEAVNEESKTQKIYFKIKLEELKAFAEFQVVRRIKSTD